jgi:hypothetical protein
MLGGGIELMRPLISIKPARISIKPARIAACAYVALTLPGLLPATAVGASAAQNVFGGAAQSSTQAATPTPAKGAVKVTTQVAKQSAAGAKFAPPVVKTAPSVARTPKTTATTTTTATTATQEASTGTSSSMIIALVLGVLLLGGIAFVIVRDARSVAPVVEGATGGTRNPEGRLRKRRAQAKAARRQRKRHRKR